MAASVLNGSLPGNSLTTHATGDRPWERPPQLNSVEESLGFYMTQLSDQDTLDDLLVAIQSGVPIKPLVEALYTSSVMKGVHSLDVGLLIAPALMEYFAAVADSYDIEYKFSNRDPKKEMLQKERARVTMLLDAAINRAEEQDMVDEGTELLKDMAEYTRSDMSRAEAADVAPEENIEETEPEADVPMDEPVEVEQNPNMDQAPQQQEELPPEQPMQGGGLMSRG